jgi:hypothetical protein
MHGTIVTLLKLPYEETVYESPVYPGTLTYHGTVPNIELFRQVSGPRSAKGRGRYQADEFQLREFVWTILFHEAGSHRYGKCL